MNKYEKLITALQCSGDGIAEEADGLGCTNKKCKYRDVDGACDLISMTLDAVAAITALQSENAELTTVVKSYAVSARSIALWLRAYCDRSLPYDKMISDAAQKAASALSRVEAERDAARQDCAVAEENHRRAVAERDQIAGWVDLFCEMIEESFGRPTSETGGARAALAEIGWRGAQGEG